MRKRTVIGIGILALAGIGAYLYYRYQKAQEKWLKELPGGLAIPPISYVAPAPYIAPITATYQERLATKYNVPVETVTKLIEAIPESTLGPPPEVVAEKILRQR